LLGIVPDLNGEVLHFYLYIIPESEYVSIAC